MDTNETFPKEEKLKSRKQIAGIFEKGQNHFIYPFKILYLVEHSEPGNKNDVRVQFGISVPRKKIKTAVSRNRIKRHAREAYRRNKSALIHAACAAGTSIYLMAIYVGTDVADRAVMESSMIRHLQYLQNEISG